MFQSRKRSTLISVLIHAAVILLLLIAGRLKPLPPPVNQVTMLVSRDISEYLPRVSHTGGGGGGTRDPTPASKGQLARVALRQFTPPTAVYRNLSPQLTIEPTLVGTPQISAVLPNIPYGDPNGVSGPPSNGPGKKGGIGTGNDGGQGGNRGPGSGPGDDGGVSGIQAHILGSIVAPFLLTQVDPEYTDEARRAKLQGVVVLHIDVDAHGRPQNIKVVEGLGLGLDERAVDAVSQWKFRPGTVNGKPAVTSAEIRVTFRLL
jgi:TonB family protein